MFFCGEWCTLNKQSNIVVVVYINIILLEKSVKTLLSEIPFSHSIARSSTESGWDFQEDMTQIFLFPTPVSSLNCK